MRKRLFLILTAAFMLLAVIAPLSARYVQASANGYYGTSAASMLTLETSTNRVLFQKDADRKRPMASTTKIVTAITVLEKCKDIDRIVTVPKEAVGIEGSSIYLEHNEKLTIKDLLYGLMLQSGNDCAVALAYITSGGVPQFADEMNKLALKAGAKSSNFVNPHGLHNDKHYTTARDLALIASYAMKNPIFKEIVGTKKYTTPWYGRNYDRIINNKNKILFTFEGGNGIKTGFTKRAGRCLVSSAERDGMEVVTVVLNCGPMFEDCRALMAQAFKDFSMTQIITKDEPLGSINVERSKTKQAAVGCTKTLSYPLTAGEKSKLKISSTINDRIKAPVVYGQDAGKIQISLENQLLFEEKLYTIEEVKEMDIKDYLKELAEKWNE